MEKVRIIDVNLDDIVQQIVADDVRELTDANRSNLQRAITDLQSRKKGAKKPYDKVLAEAYEHLKKTISGGDPISSDDLLEICSPTITNKSALATKLKTYLRKHHNNQYVLDRVMRKGMTHYKLRPFNIDEQP